MRKLLASVKERVLHLSMFTLGQPNGLNPQWGQFDIPSLVQTVKSVSLSAGRGRGAGSSGGGSALAAAAGLGTRQERQSARQTRPLTPRSFTPRPPLPAP